MLYVDYCNALTVQYEKYIFLTKKITNIQFIHNINLLIFNAHTKNNVYQ